MFLKCGPAAPSPDFPRALQRCDIRQTQLEMRLAAADKTRAGTQSRSATAPISRACPRDPPSIRQPRLPQRPPELPINRRTGTKTIVPRQRSRSRLPDTGLLAAARVFAHSRSTHLPAQSAAHNLFAARRTRSPKRLDPPAIPPAPADAVRPSPTSGSNTPSVPHALSRPPETVPGHPPFLLPTHSGSPVFFPALSGKCLATLQAPRDFAAAAGSAVPRGSDGLVRQTMPHETAGFPSKPRTKLCRARKHRSADRIASPAPCVPAKNNPASP